MRKRAAEGRKGFFVVLMGVALVLPSISEARGVSGNDYYIYGYTAAVLGQELHLRGYSLIAKDRVITEHTKHHKAIDWNRIFSAPKDVSGGWQIEISEWPDQSSSGSSTAENESRGTLDKGEKRDEGKGSSSAIFPGSRLFDHLLADQRWPHFSASYQNYINDKETKYAGATNFGATFAFFQGGFPLGGSWELGIQAGVFAIFDLKSDTYDLVNADYWIAFPALSYRHSRFSALARLFHQSSHLGDKYILHNRTKRVNPSYEAVDLKGSYDLGKMFRIYGGAGYIFHKEPPDLKPWSVQYGTEFRNKRAYLRGMVRPVAAVGFQNHEESGWRTDFSLRAGFQFEGKERGSQRFFLLLEYFAGRSPNGQFYERSVEYTGIGVHFYY
ncbi:MAG: DUF1207 domain-containing protein [Deltaproteobacteria bacterium]|nr:DUF1207 domain-containing protein [Deltaproteobacteria bacterium]